MNNFLPHYSENPDERYLVEMPGMVNPATHCYDFENGEYDRVQSSYDRHISQLKKYPASWLTSEMKEPMEFGKDFEIELWCNNQHTLNGIDSFVMKVRQSFVPRCPNCHLIAVPLSPSEEVMEDERIICAAIWYKEQPTAKILPPNIDKGVVICGHRHGHCISSFVALTGKRSVLPECGEYVQGFITEKNKFVDRQEAYKIAFAANQIIGPNKGCSENSIGLTSEDIY